MKITDELTEVQVKEMEIELLKEKLRYMEIENDKLTEQLNLPVVNCQREQLKDKHKTTLKEFAIELLDISDNPENSNKEWKKVVLENSIAKMQEELQNL